MSSEIQEIVKYAQDTQSRYESIRLRISDEWREVLDDTLGWDDDYADADYGLANELIDRHEQGLPMFAFMES